MVETSGPFGRDASTVSLEDVRDIDVSVGLRDKLFGTGSLVLPGGRRLGQRPFRNVTAPCVRLERIETTRHEAEQRVEGRPV